ncbi:MAG: PHP domain-containing protein [Promethearchaeota archaeon]
MRAHHKIKENTFFYLISFLFLLWLGFLLVLSFFAERVVIFHDGLRNQDVSDQFTSTLPWNRYLVEPFYGLMFSLETNFEYLIGIVIVFIVFRTVYFLLKRRGLKPSERFQLLTFLFKDFMRSSFIILGIMMLAILIIIGIGNFNNGFFFVNRFWNQIIYISIHAGFLVLLGRILQLLIKTFRQDIKFKYSNKKIYQPPKSRVQLTYHWRFVRRESVYLFGTMLLVLEAHLLLMYTIYPTHVITTDLEDDEFLFDFHVHTIMSDGWTTPEERVQWYVAHSISGAAFSDHDNIRGATIARNYVQKNNLDFVVWIAQEWTDHENDIHMNIYGIEEDIVPLESQVDGGPLALNASDMIKYVKKKGGYVTVNHYNSKWNEKEGGLGVPYTYEQLRDWGVDGFEIVNGPSVQEEEIRDFCLKNGLVCIGGSDTHINEDLTTVIKIKLTNPEDKSLDNIFKNLRRNTHEVIAIELHPRKVKFPDIVNDMGGIVLENFLEYLINLNYFQIISWMAWSTGSYLLFFVLYRRSLKIDIKYLRAKIL